MKYVIRNKKQEKYLASWTTNPYTKKMTEEFYSLERPTIFSHKETAERVLKKSKDSKDLEVIVYKES